MNAVLEKARQLANALVESDEYKNMKTSEDTAMAQPEVAALMAEFIEGKNALKDIMSQQTSADLIKDKARQLEDMQRKLNSMPPVAEMIQKRNEFSALMGQVNQILQFMVMGKISDDDCSGNCSGCTGCAN